MHLLVTVYYIENIKSGINFKGGSYTEDEQNVKRDKMEVREGILKHNVREIKVV